jgi:hypothetical protein
MIVIKSGGIRTSRADELWTLQQDNAPWHTTRSIVEYMEEINMQVLPSN